MKLQFSLLLCFALHLAGFDALACMNDVVEHRVKFFDQDVTLFARYSLLAMFLVGVLPVFCLTFRTIELRVLRPMFQDLRGLIERAPWVFRVLLRISLLIPAFIFGVVAFSLSALTVVPFYYLCAVASYGLTLVLALLLLIGGFWPALVVACGYAVLLLLGYKQFTHSSFTFRPACAFSVTAMAPLLLLGAVVMHFEWYNHDLKEVTVIKSAFDERIIESEPLSRTYFVFRKT